MTGTVRDWLEQLGFAALAQAFEDNAVDMEVLPELNNEDLKDLGVVRLGDRKRLLGAIAKLAGAVDDKSSATKIAPSAIDASAIADTSPTEPRVEAEFRLLTVMFCDMVGSTALSTRIDAEQLRRVISRFQTTCTDAVKPLGGFVARYMGDGMLIYFGYPKANENDAERAVAAGLAVVQESQQAIDVQVRVGIATGRVIVGDLLGQGPAEERTVVGETPNLAARLQACAAPGAVVVSDTTRLLAGGGFEFADLEPHELKGFSTPVTAWRVVGSKAIESRFESNRSSTSTLIPLFGRKTELMLLMDRWELACGGEGQAVFIAGEAGIGKSRLIEALRAEAEGLPHVTLRYQCSSHYSTSALYPVISQIQRAARFELDDTVEQKLDRLEALLASTGRDTVVDKQIFAHLLSLPFAHRYGELQLTSQQVKSRTLETLLSQILNLAQVQPLLLLVEDTHWIDPASEEFLELLIGGLENSRVLLVVTHRPDWQANSYGHNNTSSLQLNRLGRASCASMVRTVAGEFVSDEVVERIVKRTDGIPLFIEELTKSLVEGGLDIAEADIPATLQASLLARIDRLSVQTKEIMQIAAVIGREFSLELIRAVVGDGHNSLSKELLQLVQSEFLFQSGTASEMFYTFKHGLVQDSIYENMLSDVRQNQHLNVARTLVESFPHVVETAPELIAHHFTEAECIESAITWWHRAGKRSAARSADAVAVVQLQRAIDALEKAPSTTDTTRQNLSLHMDLTGPLIAIGGYGSEQMDSNTRRALSLAEQVNETDRIFPVLYGKFVFQLHTGLVVEARQQAADFLELAQRVGQPDTVIQGQRIVGFAELIAGQPARADQQLTKAAAYTTPKSGASSPSEYGQDIEAAAKVLAAWAKLHCGFPEQAIDLYEQALARATQLNHANTMGVVLFHGGNMFVSLRLADRVRETLAGLRALYEKHDLSLWRVAESVMQPGLMSLTDDHLRVIGAVESAMEVYTGDMHMRMHVPYMLSQSAGAYLQMSQPDMALEVIAQALQDSAETGVHIEDPELRRLKAIALHQMHGVSGETEAAFDSALVMAREMEMNWYELRITTDFARYLCSAGRREAAQSLLTEVVNDFTEGENMPDMQRARAVLAKGSKPGLML